MYWKNRLIKKATLDSPVVEMTPVIWKGRLLVVETWQRHWEHPPGSPSDRYVRIRDEETNRILARFMDGYCLSSAFVWEDTIYVFASRIEIIDPEAAKQRDVNMSSSKNLTDWTEPKVVLEGEPDEQIYNQSVCYDGKQFVMAYESNDKPAFTIKFAESSDLQNWHKVKGVHGADRYAACPAIRYVGGYYYMLYLERRSPRWWFETCLSRSKNLVNWHGAPTVITPDPDKPIHPDCPKHPTPECPRDCEANGREINTSDPDLIEWQGKTRVYFTGGCQHWGGYLQYAEFDGSMQEFFESYYE